MGRKGKQDGTRWKRIYKRYEGKFAYFPIISAWHLVRSLFSSTEPGKKIASRPRERNIVLMSPGMLRYPPLRACPSSLPPSLSPFPDSPVTPDPETSVMPPTFNPVFVPLRFRVLLRFPPSPSALFLYLSDDSPPLIPDDNIQFASLLVIRTRCSFSLSIISEARRHFCAAR